MMSQCTELKGPTLRIAGLFLARLVVISITAFVAASCDSRHGATPPATPTTTHAALAVDDAAVIKVLAELLNQKETDIKPGTILADLGMDDLDFVETIMDLEDQYQISIPDERIMKNGITADNALHQLTVHDLVLIVRDCQEHPVTRKPPAKPQ
jgi:acyl carrier protein